ncbi:hypothetical protein P872_12675 [Rhodonellum psychrophilum GCM71 = DSM 17998]|uniref:Glycosyltransferase subfamily 4-like N-terminal domain-containing protein n=2 Tax=Rhodonellum TaxID=336827 RepID=U5BXH8_9BACT|nr:MULTISPECIES: glycosyltransferase family 4 protein [Rhodonellum]ERM80622.1 hypothetical protein P872_12675 [Rhodonellum psychrophilum GCM71 = DSM 17998]SDZ55138.1 Glycosyltransferase involved in cell wall bisynthesis [Rhodonellum ikkaensis]
MRIIQLITRKQRRGAEIFACQLGSALKAKGHEVQVLSLFDGSGDLPFDGEVKRIHADPKKRFYDWKSWKKLAEFVRDFQPDIIQANASETLKFAVLSQLIFGWKVPIVYRNANQISGFLRNGFQKTWNRLLLERVAGIASVSEASASDVLQTFQLKSKPIRVIPIGIDSLEIDQKRGEEANLKLPETFLIQIGGWVPEKDPLGMIGVFERLAADLPDLHLVFMGSGSLEKEMRQRIQKSDFLERIHLNPNQANIFPILSKARALVMPSKIEGLPGVILEAMYCGVPVIAYDVGGIGEVLQTRKTGFLVPKNDTSAFGQAIHGVLNHDHPSLTQILQNAKILVEEQYTIQKVTDRFEYFYREVANSFEDRRKK